MVIALKADITVSDIVKLFGVHKDIVKKWCYLFAEYLSTSATQKGTTRKYTQTDIRVFALVSNYRDWQNSEAEQDYSDIFYALNSKEQYDDIYNEFVHLYTPLFQDIPEDITEEWVHGVVVGGFGTYGNKLPLARGYKEAGDRLFDIAVTTFDDPIYIFANSIPYVLCISTVNRIISKNYCAAKANSQSKGPCRSTRGYLSEKA